MSDVRVTGYGLPPINLRFGRNDSAELRRMLAVGAALEVIRASYLGGNHSHPLDAAKLVSAMADEIQSAIKKVPEPD